MDMRPDALPAPANERRRFFSLPGALLLAVLVYFGLSLYTYYNNVQADTLFFKFGYPVIAGLSACALMGTPLRKRWDGRLLIAFALWVFVREAFSAQSVYATYTSSVYHVLLYALIAYPFAMAGGGRRALDAFLHACVGGVTLLGMLALYAVITQTHITSPLGAPLGLSPYSGHRLYLFMNPNIGGTLMTVMVPLAIYLLLRAQRVAGRIWCGVCIFVLFTVQALTDARTGMIATSVSVGCLGFLIVRRALGLRGRISWALGLPALLCAAVLCFGAYQIPIFLTNAGMAARQGEQAVSLQAPELPISLIASARAQAPSEATQPRGLGYTATFMQRADVWRAALTAARENPSILLRGTGERGVMRAVLPYATAAYDHVHNAFLQTLVAYGLPGLLLLLAFLGMVCAGAMRLSLTFSADVTLADRFLPAMLLGCLVTCFAESQFFVPGSQQYLYDPFFFVVAGAVLEAARTLRKKAA